MLKMNKITRLLTVLPTSLCLWAQDIFVGELDKKDEKPDDCASEDRRIPIGGQAVIEGVLMKGPRQWGLAVRQPNGEIFKDRWLSSSRTKSYPWKLPVLRGVVTMVEMLGVGFRALEKSAKVALEETEEELTKKDMFIVVCVAVAAVVGLFIALPMWLGEFAARSLTLSVTARNVLEGVARGVVFVSYVACIGLFKDIQQVFKYHGAEHKTINAYEKADKENNNGDSCEASLMPDTIINESRIHPRCGTSFLLVAILIGIAVFSVIGKGGFLWRVGSRVTLLPLVIGVSYELIRLVSRSGFIGRLLMSPMLSLQYITTREPDLRQVEVALTSLNVALERE